MHWSRDSLRRKLFSRRGLRAGFELLEEKVLLVGDAGHVDHLEAYYYPPTTTLIEYGRPLTDPTAGDALEIATNFLQTNADDLGLSAEDLDDFEVSNQYQSSHNGVTHIYLRQEHNGLPIANATLNINVMPDGSVLNVGSSFLAGLEDGGRPSPTIGADAALFSLADYFDWDDPQITVVQQPDPTDPSQSLVFGPSGLARRDIQSDLQYVPVEEGGVELAWRLNVKTIEAGHWYNAWVSADDGEVLYVSDWVAAATYNVFEQPIEDPSVGNRSLAVDPQDATASPYGWHDINGAPNAEYNSTRGNNVFAFLDRNGDDVPDRAPPDGGSALVFDFALDLTIDPDDPTYQDAAVTNLFYWNNIMHDVLYQYGFDEPAGNFQSNNYGNGGEEGDHVLANAQDEYDLGSSGNAFFYPPPDGENGEMAMFIWDDATPSRDSSFDNGVIAHEYGHGLSTRLTAGPGNSDGLETIQSGGMGEGWSDFILLMFTQTPAMAANDSQTVATYLSDEPPDGAGIRTLPYTYDFAVNNHSYEDIIGAFSTHFAGETWASTLWDLNWALIEGNALDPAIPTAGLGFDPNLHAGYQPGGAGNQLALQLVIDGMKLQPANPTFLEARDAILAADVALTGGQYQHTIWTVFARRGMGFDANDGGSSAVTQVANGTTVPGIITGTKYFDHNQNGMRDADEDGVAGYTIYVDVNNNGSQEPSEPSTVTTADGTYVLAVSPGTYMVREEQRENWTQISPDADQDFAHEAEVISATTVAGLDFGNFAGPGTISGQVWGDLNQNGLRDGDEKGLPNITVFIDNDGDAIFSPGDITEVTDRDGNYFFAEVNPGNKAVYQILPNGMTQTFPTNNAGYQFYLDAAEDRTSVNFGNFYEPATVAGFVYHDVNGNGQRDSGERGLANIRVYLDLNRDGQLSLSEPQELTNEIGRYQFILAPGEFEIRVGPMLGFAQSEPADGGPHALTVEPNDLLVNNNFGLRGFVADFGDAPTPYPTYFTSGGAAHEFVPGPVLGSVVSPDLNGKPSVGATADDDDGVTFTTTVEAGLTATVQVTASVPGFVFGWVDFDANGVWDATAEQIIAGQQVGPAGATFNFEVPTTAIDGLTYARFRISSAQGLLPTGVAPDGEVEDYAVVVVNNIPQDDPDDPDDGGATGPSPLVPDSFTNPVNPADVDGNGAVTLSDAFLVLADIRANGTRALSTPSGPVAAFIDTNGDSRVSLSDALEVVRVMILNRAAAAAQVTKSDAEPGIKSSKQSALPTAEAEPVVDVYDQALLAETSARQQDESSSVVSREVDESIDLIVDDVAADG